MRKSSIKKGHGAGRSKPKSASSKAGSIRIISGQWRGKKLPVLDAEGLRPTTDRVKETLFNWLMHDVDGANCLDCFAGSGGLGFEALSRYAQKVCWLELNKQAATQIKQNLASLSTDKGEVINTDSLKFLQQAATQSFDLVFVDPPFRKGLLEPCVSLLEKNGWLSPEALIYVELESEVQDLELPETWRLLKQKDAGQVSYRLYQKI